MRKIVPFNRLEILSTDITQLQNVSQEELRDRLTDGLVTPGIEVPSNMTGPSSIRNIINNATGSGAFEISNYSGKTTFDLGSGVAIDSDGERIEIDDSVPCSGNLSDPLYDPPRFKTFGVSGDGTGNYLTPFSTGSKTVSDPDPTASLFPSETTYLVNTFTCFKRFVFVSYVSVVETVANPSNHEGNNGTSVPADDYRKPLTSIDQKGGNAYAYRRKNGYRVYVARESELSGTSPYPALATAFPSPEDSAKAVFVGCYYFDKNNKVIQGVDGTISALAHPRPIFRTVPMESAKINSADKTTVYSDSQLITLIEHVNAVGSGTVSPSNPHGTTNVNTGTDTAIANNGLIDASSGYQYRATGYHPANSPIADSETLIFKAAINNTPYTNATSGLLYMLNGASTPVPLLNLYRVEFPALTADQGLFIDGNHLITSVTPVSPDSGTGKSFVPFIAGDLAGLWAIYAMRDPNNASGAILGKQWLNNGQSGSYDLTVLPPKSLALCVVYWDNSAFGPAPTISQSRFNNAASAIDVRSIGTVSLNQISTDAISHTTKGMFSKEAFSINKIQDGDFLQNPWFQANTWASMFWQVGTTASAKGTLSLSPQTGAVANINDAWQVLCLSLAPDGTTGEFKRSLRTTWNGISQSAPAGNGLGSLKPLTNYVLSGMIWADNAPPYVNFDVKAEIIECGSNVEGSVVSDIKDVIFTRDGGWHKFSLTLTTTASISVLTTCSLKFLIERQSRMISSPVSAGDKTTRTIKLANLMLTEGEWLGGFVGNTRTYVYSMLGNNCGATNVCPATITAPGASYVNVTKTLFRLDDGAVANGAAPSVISNGQQCTITAEFPHTTYFYFDPLQVFPANTLYGITAQLNVDGTTVDMGDHAQYIEAYRNIFNNTYNNRSTLVLRWQGYLAPGRHTVYGYITCYNLIEGYYGTYVREYLAYQTNPKIMVTLH